MAAIDLKFVPDVIVPHSTIAIVGEAPGTEEHRLGRPFVGPSGKKLEQMLALAGVRLSSCSLLNVYHYRPKGNKIEFVNHNEIRVHREILRRELEKLKPTLIIALGNIALENLTACSGIENYRGSVLQSTLIPSAKVLATYHPSAVLRDPSKDYAYQYDFSKVAMHKDTPELLRKPLEITISDDLTLFEALFLAPDFVNDPGSRLSFDIECNLYEMTCIGFAKDANHAYVMQYHHMNRAKRKRALVLIDRILRSPVKKIAQNGNFDITYLAWHYKIKVENFWFDTMLAQHCLYPTTPKGLDFLASIYTNECYWKSEGKQWKSENIDWQQFYEYNGKDAANTYEIYEAQEPLLEARGVEKVFRTEMELCYPLITMELHGMAIDQDRKKALYEANEELITKLQKLLDYTVGYPVNIQSPKQMKDLLYNHMKLPKRFKNGKLTTNEDALFTLIPHGGPLMKILMNLRELLKRRSFFKPKVGGDGRIRTTFKPGGTITGRLSSSKSITGTGTNLQNQPKIARQMFVADPGHILINGDYSKAESWIVAYMANDEKMIAALEDGGDFHKINASNILGIPIEEVGYNERQLGKRISHACNYGTTAFTFRKVMQKEGHKITKAECQDLLDGYFVAYPKIRQLQNKIKDKLFKDMTLVNMFGRKVTFFAHKNDTLFRSAFSWQPQGTVGDLTNRALIKIYNEMPDVTLLLQIHDALLSQVREELLTDELIARYVDCMSVPVRVNAHTIVIPVDIEVGYNWYDMVGYEEWKASRLAGKYFTENNGG